mmetsp:Transcript_6451/g.19064  ORF Transcript_6451/g.19064 Transcript_6451/m.19064 type:complete len:405 (+) Transcript_6451:163-1377(+)
MRNITANANVHYRPTVTMLLAVIAMTLLCGNATAFVPTTTSTDALVAAGGIASASAIDRNHARNQLQRQFIKTTTNGRYGHVRSQHRRHSPSSSSSTATQLQFSSVEDVLFNAQSAASDLASISLNDPSDLLTSIPIMYSAGLLTSFSPCVWGLLPLTMSYISTAAGERKDKATLLPTVAFAGGLALVFCSLGIIASSVGGVLYGNSGSMNIALPLVSNGICCLMGLQLLELIRVPLPSLSGSRNPFNGNKATTANGGEEMILIDGSGKIINGSSDNNDGEKGSLVRTFLLGGSSALVASSCATPVLAAILAYVANSSDPLLGGALLLFYTLGYATPLLAVAASGGQLLVNLKEMGSDDKSVYARIAPWITPLTAGVLLWFGTDGVLTVLLGDPSLAGLSPILE